MNIAIFGLGYVGCVSVACLAKLGNSVTGVDINPHKVDLVNQGRPTIIEKDIKSLMEEQHKYGRISAVSDVTVAMDDADLSMICVSTPSDTDGYPDLQFIWDVAKQIGKCLRGKVGFHIIVIRSTVPPGTCQHVEEIIADLSHMIAEQDFAVVSNPEFLREGTSVYDYFHPSYTVIGTQNTRALGALRQIYSAIEAPIIEVPREVAEMIKYVSNSYHALKVVFANEVSAICRKFRIDSHQVIKLFCQDHQLNISPAYLMPGFAFGGSCLPKDLRALNAMARRFNMDVPVFSAIMHSNALQVERALKMIMACDKRRIGVLGLTFKTGTDDLRESPVIELLERLLGKGYELVIHDQNVVVSMLVGANRQYIESRIPHLARLLVQDLDEVCQFAEVIVVTQRTPEYQKFVQEILPTKTVIDLVRIFDECSDSNNYFGIGW
jgi:GDP-mannose 6-dehydrogenase